MKTRRIGTLTLGTSLVIFGLLFVIRIFVPNFDYIFIARCWPIILILLGSEVLASCFHSKDKEEQLKYDFAAVFIIIILAFFAMGMASAEFYMDNYTGYWGY